MVQPPLSAGITLTQPSQWVWHVWFGDKRVGTVFGDRSCGFVAEGMDSNSIGNGYLSAEEAMQAWIQDPRDGEPSLTDLRGVPSSMSGTTPVSALPR